jgi:hypothetical protein
MSNFKHEQMPIKTRRKMKSGGATKKCQHCQSEFVFKAGNQKYRGDTCQASATTAGYPVKVVPEHDFKQNKEQVIEECINFLTQS